MVKADVSAPKETDDTQPESSQPTSSDTTISADGRKAVHGTDTDDDGESRNKEDAPTASATKQKNNEPALAVQKVTVGTLADAKNPNYGNGDEGKGCPKKYQYCDFAQVEAEDYDLDMEIDNDGLYQAMEESTAMAAAQTLRQQSMASFGHPLPVVRASRWVRSQRFPVKLYALLSQPQLSHIITWMPHGRSWKVLKPKIFEASVLPVFFESDNYHSFNRVINAWSFRRKSQGPDRGSYFHELFLRGKPHLQKYMRRLPRTHKKLAMGKDEEPDFFELNAASPLPTLDQARSQLETRKRQRIQAHFETKTVVQSTQLSSTNDGEMLHHAQRHPLALETAQKASMAKGSRVQVEHDMNGTVGDFSSNRAQMFRQAEALESPQNRFRHMQFMGRDQATLMRNDLNGMPSFMNGGARDMPGMEAGMGTLPGIMPGGMLSNVPSSITGGYAVHGPTHGAWIPPGLGYSGGHPSAEMMQAAVAREELARRARASGGSHVGGPQMNMNRY